MGPPEAGSGDKTNFLQGLMHMVKGNLGTGILAMPASFAHTGLVSALLGLPMLCIIATYCVHLLIRSTALLESTHISDPKPESMSYASLAKGSFRRGPRWMKAASTFMSHAVDGILLISQVGVCCVYLVFVVENLNAILQTYKIVIGKTQLFVALFPIALLLSFIRTLKRLAVASACANLLQALGITCILEYLLRDMGKFDLSKRDLVRPWSELALGFGSAMFAFEGISVVLPIYLNMKNQKQMSGLLGLINVSYGILLVLYFCIGFFGYLRFGLDTRDSITLNLPPEPLYDIVRAMFATSVLLTYPLQFYVPNEIVWSWAKRTLLKIEPTQDDIRAIKALASEAQGSEPSQVQEQVTEEATTPVIKKPPPLTPQTELIDTKASPNFISADTKDEQEISNQTTRSSDITTASINTGPKPNDLTKFEAIDPNAIVERRDFLAQDYCCRIVLVSLTFILAVSVPKLNLLMDLIGSITGTSLSLIIPGLIHMACFWNETKGIDKISLVSLDLTIIAIGLVAGISGSIFSLTKIIHSFND